MENKNSAYKTMLQLYPLVKVQEVKGRYLTYPHIDGILKNLGTKFQLKKIGESTLGIPVHKVTLGSGKIKVLAWSQMHGNESTTTKSVLDVLNAFYTQEDKPVLKQILEHCTISVIPMLNPDGALAYTRVNANNVDLNRDAKDIQEKESKLLRKVFEDFEPDFCFNLHDQRTIFSAGNSTNPASISFLTPAMDAERSVTPSRIKSMQLIAAMAEELKADLNGQIGRYDDSFNINCTGDSFQSRGVPTILFEAGHLQMDYQREKIREYVAAAILCGLSAISSGSYKKMDFQRYFDIPENQKLFYDVILRNVLFKSKLVDVAIQFKEVLSHDKIEFIPVIEKISPKLAFYAHREIQCDNSEIWLTDNQKLSENVIVNKIFVKDEIFTINYENSYK
ncbi:MAG: M14 family metallopeptidase [Gillisia sp.]